MTLLFYITGIFLAAIIVSDMRRVRHKLLICLLWPAILAAMILRDLTYILAVILTRSD